MTIKLSSKQEIIRFISEHFITPPTAYKKETFLCQIYSEEEIEWIGDGDFPLTRIDFKMYSARYGNEEFPKYIILSNMDVQLATGVSPPFTIGTFNDCLTNEYDENVNYNNVNLPIHSLAVFNWQYGTLPLPIDLQFNDGTTETITKHIVILRNIIATANSTVENGRSETSQLTYQQGKSFTAGQSYTVYADYPENTNYEGSEAVGTLEILRKPTTATLTVNSNNITIGETVTTTIIVKDADNEIITQGHISIYDNDTLLESNYIITGASTNIQFIPSTVGSHNLYALYIDDNNEYNSFRTNTVNVTVSKKSTTITPTNNSVTTYYGDSITLTGSLQSGSTGLATQNVSLKDYAGITVQTVTTDSSGNYSITYTPSSWSADGQNMTIVYNGDNTHNSTTATVQLNLQRHNVTLTSSDVTGYTDDEVELVIDAVDENGDPVTEGTVTVDIKYIQLRLNVTGTTFNTYDSTPFTFTDELSIDYGDGTTETITENKKLEHTYSTSENHTIIIEGNITAINDNCFFGVNTWLTSVILPDTITSLGDNSFNECQSLTSINIPESVTTIGEYCFFGCNSLTSINIPEGVTTLVGVCDTCGNLTSVALPNTLTTLGDYCFNNCIYLDTITIPSNVTSIGDGCFNACFNLNSVTLPNNLTSLGEGVFDGCTSLTSLTIPNTVTNIGEWCFNGCTNLNNITFEWTTSDTILAYNSNWKISSTTTIYIPQGTTSLYTDKGYPSSQLVEVQ